MGSGCSGASRLMVQRESCHFGCFLSSWSSPVGSLPLRKQDAEAGAIHAFRRLPQLPCRIGLLEL